MKNVGSVYRRRVISGVLQEFLGVFMSLFPIPNVHTGPEFRSTGLHGVLPFPCPLDSLWPCQSHLAEDGFLSEMKINLVYGVSHPPSWKLHEGQTLVCVVRLCGSSTKDSYQGADNI